MTTGSSHIYTLPWVPAGCNTNHQYERTRNGNVRLRPAVEAWRNQVILAIRGQKKEGLPRPPLCVSIAFYPPDMRKRDVDGLVKPVLDALALALDFDDSIIEELHAFRRQAMPSGRIVVTMRSAQDNIDEDAWPNVVTNWVSSQFTVR